MRSTAIPCASSSPGTGRCCRPSRRGRSARRICATSSSWRPPRARRRATRLSPGYAVVHVYEVEPPRPDTADFAIYGIHGGNARLALREQGVEL